VTRPARDSELAESVGFDLRRRVGVVEALVGEQAALLESLRRAMPVLLRLVEAAAHARADSAPARAAAPEDRRHAVERVPATVAARRLGCDVRTVRRLIEAKRLRGAATPLGGGRKRWSVEAQDLERLVAEGAPAAPAARASVSESSASRADAK